MYRSFSMLSVRDDLHLRDAGRIRTLRHAKYAGLKLAAAVFAAAGLGFLAGSVWALSGAAGAGLAGGVYGVSVFCGLCALGCLATGYAFFNEVGKSPLTGYLSEPQAYEFVKGRITEAVYLSSGEKSGRRMLLRGEFGEKGLFLEEFDPSVWSRAVAEKGEAEHLKEGDDRYGEKGSRFKLPLEVWVLYRRDNPANAALAGIPSGLAALLDGTKK